MRHLLVLAVPLTAAACAAGPCDATRDNNIFTVGNCVMGGGYDRNLDLRRRDLFIAGTEANAASYDANRAGQRYQATAAEAAALRNRLASDQARTAQMQRRIANARGQAGADQ